VQHDGHTGDIGGECQCDFMVVGLPQMQSSDPSLAQGRTHAPTHIGVSDNKNAGLFHALRLGGIAYSARFDLGLNGMISLTYPCAQPADPYHPKCEGIL